MHRFLRQRWINLCEKENVHKITESWDSISTLYGDSKRHYHTLEHVADCLEKLDAWHKEIPERSAVEFAIWFHDIIYDAQSENNELQSAGLAKHFLGDNPLTEKVFQLILATRANSVRFEYSESVICDINNSILAGSEEEYKIYREEVYSEHLHIPFEIFARNRIRVLKGLLTRKNLFCDALYEERYSQLAHSNMERELAELGTKLGGTVESILSTRGRYF